MYGVQCVSASDDNGATSEYEEDNFGVVYSEDETWEDGHLKGCAHTEVFCDIRESKGESAGCARDDILYGRVSEHSYIGVGTLKNLCVVSCGSNGIGY